MRIKALDLAIDTHARFYRLVDAAIIATPVFLVGLAVRAILRRI
jgi:hypothetical protein